MDELIIELIAMIQDAGLELSDTIDIGQLPEDGGIRFQFGPGTTNKTWLNKGNESTVVILGLAKNTNQLTALQDLDKICYYVESQKSYPILTNGIEIVDVMTATRPQWVDKEDNGQYIYSMILNVKISQ